MTDRLRAIKAENDEKNQARHRQGPADLGAKKAAVWLEGLNGWSVPAAESPASAAILYQQTCVVLGAVPFHVLARASRRPASAPARVPEWAAEAEADAKEGAASAVRMETRKRSHYLDVVDRYAMRRRSMWTKSWRKAGAAITLSVGMIAGFVGMIAGASAAAPCRNTGAFEAWLQRFKQEAEAQGISRIAIAAASPYLVYDQRIVNIDRGQKFFAQDFLQFSDKMLAGGRIPNGLKQMKKHAGLFARAEQQYGVPAAVITAFWGLESDFGANMGKDHSLRALATLAYDCRRAEMFRRHLFDALRLIERGDLTAPEMIGSWAGELGQTQMMPSEYLKYAIDYDGDGKRDLLRSVADVIGSTANYLVSLGWRRGEPWLEEVRLPQNLPWEQADLSLQHPRATWAQWGVTYPGGRALPADHLKASLLLPMGRFGPAFLAYDNFHVYLKWNASLVYSTTAAYYATRLAGAPPVTRSTGPIPPVSAEDVREIQQLLARAGHDVGPADGKLGMATRAAIKSAQMRLGLPADSYPSPELLARLRALR